MNERKLLEAQITGNLPAREGCQARKVQRSKLEIMADILFVARNGAGKTAIVYRANLNFTRLKSYLTCLEAKGLLENIGTVYKSTERGNEFLRDYARMCEALECSRLE
ncbi:MAG: hypothetical protein EFT35_05280 [Methanophagales archaeon ANME-1-THS]|nr:MAG: hypothetical protein EFT35_05280 [Methanophagales archaeon ANME-1-THS]